MTVLEVKEAVLGYGFSPDLEENDGLFYTALNLAVKEINRIRPRTSSVVIVHEPLTPVYEQAKVTLCSPGSEISLSCMARSAVFEVSGTGAVSVTGAKIGEDDGATWSSVGGWVRLAAVAAELGEITLAFSGDTPFYLRNVAFYETAFPPSVELTGGDMVDYDLSRLASDFASVQLPILRDGVPMLVEDPRTLLLHGRVLRVPKAERGTYEVVYALSPRRLGEDDDGESIPLDDDLCELVPLLVASYVWLEDDSNRAARYDGLYRAAAANIPKQQKISKFIDRTGWT